MEAVSYHGEMDATSRHESYIKWKSGQVQRTKAFGMGIDELDICHVMLYITNGVPEGVLSWAYIRESVDSLCRDGADTDTPIYQMKRLVTPEHYSYTPFQTYKKCFSII